MQDGTQGNLFQLTATSSESTRVGSSISPEFCGNAPSSFPSPSSRRPCSNMLYSTEPWSRSSIPLSIFSNGAYVPAAGIHLGHARNSPSAHPENGGSSIERGPKIACSNGSSSSALKERDYIGLADSSSSVMQRDNFAVTIAVDKLCSKANFGSDCKDTELRLGLGLSLVDRADARQVETRSHSCVVESEVSKFCDSEQMLPVEQKEVPESLTYDGKISPEQCIADKTGNSCSTSENVFGSQPHGTIGLHTSRDSIKVQWNDDSYYLSQRASVLLLPTADNQKVSAQEKLGRDQNHVSKEISVGLPAQRVLPAENHVCRDGISMPKSDVSRHEVPYAHGHAPPPRCNYELRFAQHDSFSSNSNTTQSAQKPRQNSLPNESLRSSLQSGNSSEFDFGSKSCELPPRGMFMVPVSNVVTVPAKRPFGEAIGDSMVNHASENRSETRANMSVAGAAAHAGINLSSLGSSTLDGDLKPGLSQVAKVLPASRLFSWNNVIPQPAGWQIGVEQSKHLFSPCLPANSSLPTPIQGAPPPPPQLKTACASGHESAKEAPVKALSCPGLQPSKEGHSGDGGSRAPAVVGWPPIRSFRKNTLASQKLHADQELGHSSSPADSGDQAKQPSSTLFVKANMDGVPIGRKVDLKSYDSYESLKSALQDMFQRFMTGPSTQGMECASKVEHKQVNLLDGSEYVLTHEDKDGDWMLVGDVPWNMFVTTVKRLRIMKVSEAIGLGPKLKVQPSNHLVEGARGK